jgi:hypothetical protein
MKNTGNFSKVPLASFFNLKCKHNKLTIHKQYSCNAEKSKMNNFSIYAQGACSSAVG